MIGIMDGQVEGEPLPRLSPAPGAGAALRTVLAGDDGGAKNDQGVGILRCQPLVLYGVPDWSRTSGLSLRSQGR